MGDLNESESALLFSSFRISAFRLETLPAYCVPEEAVDLDRYLSGDLLVGDPDEEWLGFVRDARSKGTTVTRVRILPRPITPYVRFEIEWGYVYSATVGEDIRFVTLDDLNEQDRSRLRDFWLFDDLNALLMDYDDDGRFTAASLAGSREELLELCSLRDRLLQVATPIRTFLVAYRSGAIG